MKISCRSRSIIIFTLTCIGLTFTSLVRGQKARVNSRDLSRTLDTIIGIDIRNGKSGAYRPSKESIVPRSRHTERDRIKMSRNENVEEVVLATRHNPIKGDEVKTEDFLTLGKEERSSMPVSITLSYTGSPI